MSAVLVFHLPEMNANQYDQVISKLAEAGAGNVPGRIYHVSYEHEDGGMGVTDIWDSPDSFQEFGKTLIPILQSMGFEPAEPKVYQAHHMIAG